MQDVKGPRLCAAIGGALVSGGFFLASFTSSLVGFLEIVPLSFGSAFLWQLAASVFGLALLVGGGGAMLSVRNHLAK